MAQPTPTPYEQVPDRPAPQRLASAKVALLHDTAPPRTPPTQSAQAVSAKNAVLDAVREKPLLAMGGAALLGFFLFRKNFFFKAVLTKIIARMGMSAIRQVLK